MPIRPHIVIREWVADGKTDDEDIGMGVGERSPSIVFLLTSRVPQVQADGLAIHRCRVLQLSKAVGIYSSGKVFAM